MRRWGGGLGLKLWVLSVSKWVCVCGGARCAGGYMVFVFFWGGGKVGERAELDSESTQATWGALERLTGARASRRAEAVPLGNRFK
jgi:hypothetical protein